MTTRLDLDDGGTPQAQRGVGGHRVALDLVAVEPQDLEPGVIHHVHHGAEAADGELCGEKETQRCQGDVVPQWVRGQRARAGMGRELMQVPLNFQLFLPKRALCPSGGAVDASGRSQEQPGCAQSSGAGALPSMAGEQVGKKHGVMAAGKHRPAAGIAVGFHQLDELQHPDPPRAPLGTRTTQAECLGGDDTSLFLSPSSSPLLSSAPLSGQALPGFGANPDFWCRIWESSDRLEGSKAPGWELLGKALVCTGVLWGTQPQFPS